jgi:superfamily II DNA or RNA helicase
LDLYGFQKEIIKDLYQIIRSGEKRILLYAPTGAGKTVITSSVIKDANSRGRNILFLVHRGELVEQTIQTLERFGLTAGVMKAGWKPNASEPIQVASIQTLHSRGIPDELDIIFIDECHTTSYYQVCKDLLNQHEGLIVGITATPWRTKKKEGLSEHYSKMVRAPLPHQLIQQGFLVPAIYYGYNNEIELKNVRTRAGEFAVEDLDVVCNTPAIILRIVEEYQRLASNRTTICFAINVDHAKNIAQTFQQYGVPADYIEASTHPMARSDKYQALARGDLMVLTSVGVLTEGFDVRSIESIILARPTKSMALNYQMVGRGLRTCPETDKQDCIILDFANNTERHGMVQMLDHIEMDTPIDTEQKQLTKTCPACNAIVTLDVMSCPNCGYQFAPGEGIAQKQERLEDLVRLLPPDDKKKRQLFSKYAKHAFENGLKPTWSAVMYKKKFYKWPSPIMRIGAVFGLESKPEDQLAYLNYLKGFIESNQTKDPEKFIKDHLEWEFGDRLIRETPENDHTEAPVVHDAEVWSN